MNHKIRCKNPKTADSLFSIFQKGFHNGFLNIIDATYRRLTSDYNDITLASEVTAADRVCCLGQDIQRVNKGTVDNFWLPRHDFFNLMMLPLIVVVNSVYIYCAQKHTTMSTFCPFADWGGNIPYYVSFTIFFLYIVLDTCFILSKPLCVKSANVILAHHIVTLIAWCCPLLDSRLRMWCTVSLMVEVNTTFLTARRFFKFAVGSLKYYILEFCFFSTWIIFRLIMYPALVYFFFQILLEEYKVLYFNPTRTNANNSSLLFTFIYLLLLFLTGLNCKWSYDLFKATYERFNDPGLKIHSL